MELEADVGLKSRMRENRTYGSVRGIRQAFHFQKKYLKGVSRLPTRLTGMKITLNPDEEVVKAVKEGLKRTGGYCPCRLERSEDNKCMCKEFREQIRDPEFEGYCHCMLYYKSKE